MDSESDDRLREYEAADYSEVSDIALYNAVSHFEASALSDYDGSARTSRNG